MFFCGRGNLEGSSGAEGPLPGDRFTLAMVRDDERLPTLNIERIVRRSRFRKALV